jgi:hypothetical protein
MGTVERYRPGKTSGTEQQISIFGSPPLHKDEDLEAYNELLRRVIDLVRPTDIIEEICVRDFVDLTWERFRWRRGKAELIKSMLSADIQNVISRFDDTIYEEHIRKFPIDLEIVECLDHLSALSLRRGNEVLHKLEYCRSGSAQILSGRVPQIDEKAKT